MANYLKDELSGFVPTPQATDIMTMVARGSSMMRLGNVKEMTSERQKFPVLAEGPGAYWVGEGERIKTSKATWIFPEIVVKKMAVIIPVTKEKLADTTINVFEELKGPIAEAFYQAFDKACFMGTESPFAKNLFQAAVDVDNFIVNGTSSLDLDVSDLMALIESDGRDVNGFAAHYGIKNDLRKLRDGNGNQLFVTGVGTAELYSSPIEFARNESIDKTKAEIFAGDWSKAIVGVRQGIEYEILKEATLQGTVDADGKPISLAEQDMVAIKASMRVGFLPIVDKAFAVLATQGTTPAKTQTVE